MAKDLQKQPDLELTPAKEYSTAALAVVERAKATGHYAELNPFLLQALRADTPSEATSTGEVLSVRDDLLGERLRVVNVTFMDADPTLDSSLPFFAVIDCFREMTGVQVKASIGADQPMGFLVRACEMDWFPVDVEFVSIGLGGGRKALNAQLAPTRVDTITDSL